MAIDATLCGESTIIVVVVIQVADIAVIRSSDIFLKTAAAQSACWLRDGGADDQIRNTIGVCVTFIIVV